MLFRSSDDDFKTRLRARLRVELAEAKSAGFLVPQVVYGYFCVNADGDDLVVWSDRQRTNELARFRYPRQSESPFMCISDFFRPVDAEPDFAAFHIVTMGSAVSEEAARLFAANEYQKYMIVHGLGVEMAEALAELDRKSTRLNSSHSQQSRMPSSA